MKPLYIVKKKKKKNESVVKKKIIKEGIYMQVTLRYTDWGSSTRTLRTYTSTYTYQKIGSWERRRERPQ